MAAGITHEINQPLNAISVSANSILYWNKHNRNNLPDLFIEEIEQIAKGSKRIDEIISKLLSHFKGNKSQTAKYLNITRNRLNRKLN